MKSYPISLRGIRPTGRRPASACRLVGKPATGRPFQPFRRPTRGRRQPFEAKIRPKKLLRPQKAISRGTVDGQDAQVGLSGRVGGALAPT
jgi:hypothetical protein